MVIQSSIINMDKPAVPFIQNQLLFNLNNPASTANIPVRFRKPGPIIVERLNASPERKRPDFVELKSPMKFSAISEESLAMAVTLAKRDIKKKKLELEVEKLRKEQELSAGRSKKTNKNKAIPSKDYTAKLQHRRDRRKAGKTVQSVESQTDIVEQKTKRPPRSARSITKSTSRQTNVDYPPTTDSPPTRDIDIYHHPIKTEIEQNTNDINQARLDINNCIQKIYQVEHRAKGHTRGNSEEERRLEQKKEMHAEDKSSRTIRMLYGLQQQIRQVKEDIFRSPSHISAKNYKTSMYTKLAGVHRAYLRAVQAFVCNFSECDIKIGLPKVYKDLNMISNELTVCCHELGVVGTPPILPVNIENDRESNYDGWARNRENRIVVTEKFDEERWKPMKETVINGPAHVEEPDRDLIMRSGIASLLRARDRSPSPVFSPKPAKKKPRAKPATKKGIILPSKLKKKKVEVYTEQVPTIIKISTDQDTHYRDPTVSSQLKVREADEVHRPDSPSRSPRKDMTPRSRSHSPCSRRNVSPRHNSKYLSGLDIGLPRDWVADAERAIKAKIQPLLKQAQDLSNRNVQRTSSPNSLHQKLSQRVSEKVEVNADVLSDMILNDLLRDTASEMQKMEDEENAEELALSMKNAPQVETLLQRLNEMEREQNEIRLKWKSINYEDEASSKILHSGYGKVCKTPEPIHITAKSSSQQTEPAFTMDEGLIEFSRPTQKTAIKNVYRPRDEFDEVLNEPQHPLMKPLKPVSIDKHTLESIFDYKQKFDSYLKQTSTISIGNFNPWMLVESVSDEILSDCLKDVSKEIFDANSTATVDRVFRSEFLCRKDNAEIPIEKDVHKLDISRDTDEDYKYEYSETDFDLEDEDKYEDAEEVLDSEHDYTDDYDDDDQ